MASAYLALGLRISFLVDLCMTWSYCPLCICLVTDPQEENKITDKITGTSFFIGFFLVFTGQMEHALKVYRG